MRDDKRGRSEDITKCWTYVLEMILSSCGYVPTVEIINGTSGED